MPLPFDAVGQAARAALWLVGVVLERLIGDRVAAWAARQGLGDEVARLKTELRRANLVLGAARGGGGRKIGNEQLAESLAEVRRLAAEARNLLDELDYFEIDEKMKAKEQSCNNPISSRAQFIVQYACGFANQTSKYISSAVKINTKDSTIQQQDGSLTTKRKIDRHDIITGVKRLKLVDSNEKMAPVIKLEGDTVTHEMKLNKDDMSKRITNIVDQLHEICEDVRKALKQERLDEITRATQSTCSNPRETAACFTETTVFSREMEKNQIIEQIMNAASSNQELLVLPIIGDAGIGKTTLARLVYNDPKVKAKFAIKIWIYVSANFDEVKLTQEILEYISEDGRHKQTRNFSMLQDSVKKCLSERFLLVLDDMWEENVSRWDKLLAPLRDPKVNGNVILVTTRKLLVAKFTGTMAHINLEGLKGDVFWCFFKRCIFGDENYQGQKRLQKIGVQIVTKLKGNPLAAKSVGTLLKRNLDEVYWNRILDSDEWKSRGDLDDILPALMLSYNHLPYHLQQFFSYCALFPKGHKFDKELLVRMWIALDFPMDERKKRLEDAGSDYFDDLVDWSFFQKFEETWGDTYYLMHDLIHDLALSVSKDKCLIVDDSGSGTILPSVSHVSILSASAYRVQENGSIERNETLEKMLANIHHDGILRNLDSLMLVDAYDENFSAKFVKILEQLHCVRVLRLLAKPFNADILLSSMRRLIHLRYLELRSTNICKPLPEALCRLYHLLVLDIRYWNGLDDLPRGLSNLIKLRYLLVPGSGVLHSKISRVGELKFLQELNEFRVQKESGFEILQLENLNEIRGTLSIFNLENVIKKEEAIHARIKDKKHLRTLSLSWESTSVNPADPKGVLEGLEPHDRLEHLQINNYTGATPSWLGQNFSLTNLESLHLEHCTAMEILPPLDQAPFLEKLSLVGMFALKEINFGFNCGSAGAGFQSSEDDLLGPDEISLTDLSIYNCPALTSVRLHSCTVLQKLSIKNCTVLASLDGLQPLNQFHLDLKDCPHLPDASCIEREFKKVVSI